MDVIDEVTEEELDALPNESEPFLREVNDNFKELALDEQLRIKTSIQDPLIDLNMKPLHNHLEYAFLEKDFLLPVIISALLEADEKKRLVFLFKNHKEVFAWKTFNIQGIIPSFYKHKINFEDDDKPVIQRHHSHWVSPVHRVPKKGGMTVVTNKTNELVHTITVTGWRELRDEYIDDNFPDETFINISANNKEEIPWRCVYGSDTLKILDEPHHGPTRGHYGSSTTTKKVFDAGFYWPTIFKEAHTLVQNCDTYQRSGSLS
nr:DNA-directed DNA polymerase [Tanacetum cinerariifolium]